MRLATFSMVGHLVVRGPRALIEATATFCALKTNDTADHNAALRVLSVVASSDSESSRIFQNLVKTRYLDLKDMDSFVQLRLEVMRLHEKQRLISEGVEHIVIDSFPPIITYCEKKEGDATFREYHIDIDGKTYTMDGNRSHNKTSSIAQWSALSDSHLIELACLLIRGKVIEHYDDLLVLDRGFHQVLAERSLVKKVCFKEKSEACQTISPLPPPDSSPIAAEGPPESSHKRKEKWSERSRIPTILSADQLRAFDLVGMQISEYQMYQLICLHCFRMGTAKSMIGEVYAPVDSLKSNLLEAISGDREQTRLFYRCWDRMTVRGAIRLKKNGTVASLNPHTQEITDAHMLHVVQWVFSEHRRLTSSSPPVLMN
jgi:hypothetical protein